MKSLKEKKMDLGSAWVQSKAMLGDAITTVTKIPIMEWRA